MKKSLLALAALALLAACAGSGTGNTQMYGEIKGVESSRTTVK